MEYILGTVQLGLNYGINNVVGKPSEEESFAILNSAFDNGIFVLDTAGAYGDSERLLGEFQRNTGKSFKICSKFSGKGNLSDELHASLKALSADSLYLYYLHKFDDCENSLTLDSIVSLKEQNIIERIGISVYSPQELCFIIENLKSIIDVVQIPFSIVDNSRWISAITKASENCLDIYCRSIFLQGAIFKSLDDEFVVSKNVGEHLSFIHDLCNKYGCDIGSLAFSFCDCFDGISAVLFGCETLAQLDQNIAMINNKIEISDSDIHSIIDKMKNINPNFIDPRLW